MSPLRDDIEQLREFMYGATYMGTGRGAGGGGGSPGSMDPSTIFSRGMTLGPKTKTNIHKTKPSKPGKAGKMARGKKPNLGVRPQFKNRVAALSPDAKTKDTKNGQGAIVRGAGTGTRAASGSTGRVR